MCFEWKRVIWLLSLISRSNAFWMNIMVTLSTTWHNGCNISCICPWTLICFVMFFWRFWTSKTVSSRFKYMINRLWHGVRVITLCMNPKAIWQVMGFKLDISGNNQNTMKPAQWLSGRASPLWLGGCGLDPRPGHTKDFKNSTSCCFAWCSALRK